MSLPIPTATLQRRDYVPPYVSMRAPRHDAVVASLPSFTSRTSSEIAADRDAAVREREALEADRSDLMLTSTAETIAALDHNIAVAKVRIDQAEMQHAAAVISEAAARAAEEDEQARRKALRKQAMKASAEVAKLSEDYLAAAGKMVGLLNQIRERERLIFDANQNLPAEAEPVPPGEPFNGKAGLESRHETRIEQIYNGTNEHGKPTYRKHPMTTFIPGVAAEPHRSLSGRVYLPGLGRDASPIWGVREYVNGEAR